MNDMTTYNARRIERTDNRRAEILSILTRPMYLTDIAPRVNYSLTTLAYIMRGMDSDGIVTHYAGLWKKAEK